MLNTYKKVIQSADRILSLTLFAVYAYAITLFLIYLNIDMPAKHPNAIAFFGEYSIDLSLLQLLKVSFLIIATTCLLTFLAIYELEKSKKIVANKLDNRDITVKVVSSIIYAFAAVAFLPTTINAVLYSPLLTIPTDSPLLNAMLSISAYFIMVRLTMILTDWFLSEPKREQEDA